MPILVVNGKEREVDLPINLANFLEENNIEPRLIAIEYNGTIIKRDQWSSVNLEAGDRLEIVHMVAGG